jgi:CRP-like cAMP-binding protein
MKEDLLKASIEPLLEYFNGLIPLNGKEKQLVVESFQPRLYRRRQYVLQEGDVCYKFNFVVRGCLRMYKIDDNGNVHILQFSAENTWLTDLGSFYGHKISKLNIDALEDTMVLQITYDNLITLYKQASKFDRIFRILMENSFILLQDRLLQNISSTAEERYLFFMQMYSHLSNRLPQTQIAAFLGITPEFLSRIRNSRSKPKA